MHVPYGRLPSMQFFFPSPPSSPISSPFPSVRFLAVPSLSFPFSWLEALGKRLSQTFSGAFRVEKCYGDVLLT